MSHMSEPLTAAANGAPLDRHSDFKSMTGTPGGAANVRRSGPLATASASPKRSPAPRTSSGMVWKVVPAVGRWQAGRDCRTEIIPVSYTHLRAHETRHDLVCRLLLEKK